MTSSSTTDHTHLAAELVAAEVRQAVSTWHAEPDPDRRRVAAQVDHATTTYLAAAAGAERLKAEMAAEWSPR